MADWQQRILKGEGSSGPFFVDDNCIGCDACIIEASPFFCMDDESAQAFMQKQPIKDEDFDRCDEALACCPVEAIGRQ